MFVALPDYKSMMLPLLKFSSDCNEHSPKEAGVTLSKIFNLTDEEMAIPHPSGSSLFNNRINWAVLYYLKNSGLIKSKLKEESFR